MESSFTLNFTGERRRGQFQVEISGQAVWLAKGMLNLLIDLVICRGTTTPGFLEVPALTIHRLRKAVDRILPAGSGNTLIETGDGKEYRISIPAHELSSRIQIEPAFHQLVEKGVVSPKEAEQLRQAVCKST